MLKYFVLSVFLLALTWQAEGNNFNNTDGISIPQPHYAQLRVSAKTYTFIFTPVNWYTAVEICNSQNKVIASITSAEENRKLYNALYKKRLLHSRFAFWLGATELGHNGRWSWINTGRPLLYTNWAASEPNNGINKEHCLQLLSDGKWNDYDCDSRHRVVCQSRPSCQS
ncbi:perlucin-like protein [Calliphora vicina]|uniref:perlucin-like protein n=1 Tax=Calliphora vicina TaxID=7373 RepID=UPI00325AA622